MEQKSKRRLMGVIITALTLFVFALCLMACTPSTGNHEHTYSSSWSYIDAGHYHAATCGHNVYKNGEPIPHTYNNNPKVCDVCGYPNSEFIGGDHEHTLEHVEGRTPTCTESGMLEYWICSDCGRYFKDEAGTQEVYDKNDLNLMPRHTFGKKVEAKEPTCEEDGNLEYYNARSAISISRTKTETAKFPKKRFS